MLIKTYQTTYKNEQSYWWWVARSKILQEMFKYFAPKKSNLNILNLGCGTGILSQQFSRFGRVISLDKFKEALMFTKFREIKNLIQADAQQLPLKNNSFDVVMAYDLLEHLEDDNACLKEIERIVRQNGVIFITVPAFNFMWSVMDDMGNHKRRYTKNVLLQKIKGSNFKPIKLSYFNTLLFPLALAERNYEKLFRRKVYGNNFLPQLPSLLNNIFIKVFSFELQLLKKINLPFGLSILCIAKKRSHRSLR